MSCSWGSSEWAKVSVQTLPRLATLSSPVVPQHASARSPGPSPDRVSCSPVSQGPVGGGDAPLPAHAANTCQSRNSTSGLSTSG